MNEQAPQAVKTSALEGQVTADDLRELRTSQEGLQTAAAHLKCQTHTEEFRLEQLLLHGIK